MKQSEQSEQSEPRNPQSSLITYMKMYPTADINELMGAFPNIKKEDISCKM